MVHQSLREGKHVLLEGGPSDLPGITLVEALAVLVFEKEYRIPHKRKLVVTDALKGKAANRIAGAVVGFEDPFVGTEIKDDSRVGNAVANECVGQGKIPVETGRIEVLHRSIPVSEGGQELEEHGISN